MFGYRKTCGTAQMLRGHARELHDTREVLAERTTQTCARVISGQRLSVFYRSEQPATAEHIMSDDVR